MGMLIDGKWDDAADRTMVSGMYRREPSRLPNALDDEVLSDLACDRERFYLIASASCPWSHGAVLALTFAGLADRVGIQWAGGPRIEGYGLLPGGPLPNRETIQHVHQLYAATDPTFTGRATVPVLWDAKAGAILSNGSADLMVAFDRAGEGADLRPDDLITDIDALIEEIFNGLSNAVYRAGKSQKQDEYDEAVDTVFRTMDGLESRLKDQDFLFGPKLTLADLRLFATLVRFDTVYVTHFRCTRKRLVDYPHLWRFARRIFQMPCVAETVDFEEIRYGYYVNDGSHNPYQIVGQQPEINWYDKDGFEA